MTSSQPCAPQVCGSLLCHEVIRCISLVLRSHMVAPRGKKETNQEKAQRLQRQSVRLATKADKAIIDGVLMKNPQAISSVRAHLEALGYLTQTGEIAEQAPVLYPAKVEMVEPTAVGSAFARSGGDVLPPARRRDRFVRLLGHLFGWSCQATFNIALNKQTCRPDSSTPGGRGHMLCS